MAFPLARIERIVRTQLGALRRTEGKLQFDLDGQAIGVLRDLSVPADNTPRVSPDGRYVAMVEGDNLGAISAPSNVRDV
jgi:hypothetical protein